MSKILSTRDYSIFKKHESNREIDRINLKRIKFSIQANNMLEFRPILVDAEMRVIDGQHRLEAAKELEIAVFYQINQESTHEDIVLLNTNQKKWDANNYMEYYISRGNENYTKLKEFCKKNDTPASYILSIMGERGGKKHGIFNSGQFKFPPEEQLKSVQNLLRHLGKVVETVEIYCLENKRITKSKKFIFTVIGFLKLDGAHPDVLCTKIIQKFNLIRPCADKSGYYCMLKEIYNYRNSEPIA